MNNLLVVYELIPESTTVYFIPYTELSQEMSDLFGECHAKFSNQAGNPPELDKKLDEVSKFLNKQQHNIKFDDDTESVNVFMFDGPFQLIVTGTIL